MRSADPSPTQDLGLQICTTMSSIYVGAGESEFSSSCLLNGCLTNRDISSATKILLNRTSDINCAFHSFLVCLSMKASLIPPAYWCLWRFIILIWLWAGPRDLILTERILYWNRMSLQEMGLHAPLHSPHSHSSSSAFTCSFSGNRLLHSGSSCGEA